MEMLAVRIICLVLLIIQLFLCFKAKKLVVKFIPVAILLIVAAVFVLLMLTASEWRALGYAIYAIFSGIFLIPCAIGWIIWLISCFLKSKKSRERDAE